MKKVSLKAALLLFATISIVSCKDDDEPSKAAPDNKFTIGDNVSKIATGYFIKDLSVGHDDNENAYYRNSLFFITEGITTTTVEGETEALGEGDLLELQINNAGQELQVGTYTWQSEENEQPFDLWSAQAHLGWKRADGDAGTEFNFQSGNVVVAKSGDVWTITFEGVAVGDANHDEILDAPVNVSGKFEGSLSLAQRDF